MSSNEFYDSLEEDNYESENSPVHSSSEKDFSTIVPLYCGEISKSKIASLPKKNVKKPVRRVFSPQKSKKSYLTMYYDKMKGFEKEKTGDGSDTSRAVCKILSPKRESELDSDLKDVEFECNSSTDSEQDEFYEKMMALETEKKQLLICSINEEKNSNSKFSNHSFLTLKSPKSRYFSSSNSDTSNTNEKMELLKRRQSYGTKMSMKNRIKIEELKSLKNLKIRDPR